MIELDDLMLIGLICSHKLNIDGSLHSERVVQILVWSSTLQPMLTTL